MTVESGKDDFDPDEPAKATDVNSEEPSQTEADVVASADAENKDKASNVTQILDEVPPLGEPTPEPSTGTKPVVSAGDHTTEQINPADSQLSSGPNTPATTSQPSPNDSDGVPIDLAETILIPKKPADRSTTDSSTPNRVNPSTPTGVNKPKSDPITPADSTTPANPTTPASEATEKISTADATPQVNTPSTAAPKIATPEATKPQEVTPPSAASPSKPAGKPSASVTSRAREACKKTYTAMRGKKLALLGLLPVLLLGLFVGVWAIDQNLRGTVVARNTQINGVNISGLSGDELETAITEATDSVIDVSLTVTANDGTIVTTARELGAETDIKATTQTALDSRRSGFSLFRPFQWASSLFSTETIPATYLVDQQAADEASQTIFEPIIQPVIETSIKANGSGFVVVPGTNGEKIEASEIEAELPGVLRETTRPVLNLTPVEGVPQISETDAKAAGDDAADALSEPLPVQLLDQNTTVTPSVLRQLVTLDNSGDQVTWMIDNELAVAELKDSFSDVGTENNEAIFTIVNNKPVVVPVAAAVECCDETTGQRLKDGAVDRPDNGEFVIVEPEYVEEDPTADALNELGIIEEVSSFTTPHAAGGARVKNIQRFADLMRGRVLEVDEELSLNGEVGQRTIAKGFAADGAINQGVIEKQVGGGISQFATTFFNAAFFSGVEINQHQFHTLAIGSRYPLGRESTISWKQPDVRITNTSEHPILIWTSYTRTSITVTFYSVKHLTVRDVNGDELAYDVYVQGRDRTFPPVITSDRKCSIYTTARFTEFPDGEIVKDTYSGFYRPGPGRDCNGDLTPKAQAELDAKEAAENANNGNKPNNDDDDD